MRALAVIIMIAMCVVKCIETIIQCHVWIGVLT